MHVGERPYVVVGTLTINISTHELNLEAMTGMLGQLLPADSQTQLEEFGAVEYKIPPQGDDRFSVVAARGGDDIWIEIRRRRQPVVAAAPAVPTPQVAAPMVAPPVAPVEPAVVVNAQAEPIAIVAAEAAQPEHASEPDLQPVREPEPVVVQASEPEPEPAPEPVIVPVAEPAPQFEPVVMQAIEPEPMVEPEPVIVQAVEPEPAPEPVIVPVAEPAPQFEPVVMQAIEPEPMVEPEPVIVQAVEPEPAPEPVIVPVAEPAPQFEPVVMQAIEPEPMVEPEPVIVQAVEPEPAPEPVIVPVAEPAPQFEPVVMQAIEPEPMVEPEPVPQNAPELEAVPEIAAAIAEPEPAIVHVESPAPVEPIAEPVPEPMHVHAPEPMPAAATIAQPQPIAVSIEQPDPTPIAAPTSQPESVPLAASTGVLEPTPVAPPETLTPGVLLSMNRAVRSDLPPRTSSTRAASGIERLLRLAAARGASALFLTSDSRPWIRVEGDLRYLESEPPLSRVDVEGAILEIAPESGHESIGKGEPTEWLAEFADVGRIRCTTFSDHRGPGVLLRMIATRAATAEQLGLVREVQALATEPQGLVIVAGPRASGKSTLMSALVDLVSRQRAEFVITLERQIRLVHDHKLALVSQREIRGGADESVAAARAALRENPDVLVVDDLVSPQMVPLLLTAASEGLLVFVSITAPSTTDAVQRFVELAPVDTRKAVQNAMAESFRGAVAQVLLKKVGGGLIAAREVLLATAPVTSVIGEGQLGQLPLALESGRKHGMVSFTDALVDNVRGGTVDLREAFRKAPDRNRLLDSLKREGIDTSVVERLA